MAKSSVQNSNLNSSKSGKVMRPTVPPPGMILGEHFEFETKQISRVCGTLAPCCLCLLSACFTLQSAILYKQRVFLTVRGSKQVSWNKRDAACVCLEDTTADLTAFRQSWQVPGRGASRMSQSRWCHSIVQDSNPSHTIDPTSKICQWRPCGSMWWSSQNGGLCD